MDILTGIILPLAIVVIPLAFSFYKWKVERDDKLRIREENESLKMEVRDLSEHLKLDIEMFNDIKNSVERIFENTKADRFLILTGTNGKTDMKFASVIYEHHKKSKKVSLSIGATSKFVKFEFDDKYRKMLKYIESEGVAKFDVAKMDDGDLKFIYNNEGVNHSNIFFLHRGQIDSERDRLFFCSVATHDKESYDDGEFVIMKTSISTIRELLNKAM